jgi:hypothetical protein
MQGQIQPRHENKNKPVGSSSPRTGVGGKDKIVRSTEGVQLSAVCPTAMSSSGKADTFDLGRELDVRGSEAKARIIPEGSTLPCTVQVVTGLRELVGIE